MDELIAFLGFVEILIGIAILYEVHKAIKILRGKK